MRSHKIIFIFLVFILVIILTKIYITKSTTRLLIYKDKIITSSNTVCIPLEIYSNKDALYKLSFYLHENKKVKQKLLENVVVALKKGQNYSLNYTFNVHEKKNLLLLKIVLNEILPSNLTKSQQIVTIRKPIIQEIPKVESTTFKIVTKQNSLQQSTKENKLEFSKSEKGKIKIEMKEKPNFEIIINQNSIKREYMYDEKVKFNIIIENKSSTLTIVPKLIVSLKNENDIIVSSKTLMLKLPPLRKNQEELEFEIPKNVSPGNYFIELTANCENIHKTLQTDKFLVVDLPPKISLPEMPNIKHKLTNTILAEVEDDRGIQEVMFVEVTKKTENKYNMILVAGNIKAGLYSFTTPKITTKGTYSFYIQAKDIAGNVLKTDIYQVKISK